MLAEILADTAKRRSHENSTADEQAAMCVAAKTST